MIQVEHLRKSFGPTRAVDGISFSVGTGEVVGFLGPNGAGKTTTMRLLTTYLTPDEGIIRVHGIDVETAPLEARRFMGYLPESAPLYNDMNVLEYLKFAAAVRNVPRIQRRVRIREMVEICGLGEVITRPVGVLSKGYRQRVGLAQTMIHDPAVLILDEPTTGLDPNQIMEIRRLVREIGREKTILISTHILPEVQAVCSRVLIIHRGRIVADDAVEGLAERIRGEEIYRVRIKGSAEVMRRALEEAPFVAGVRLLDEGRGPPCFEVRGVPGSRDLGEAIFALAASREIVLSEIRKLEVSLEDVFARLTLGEEGS